jgi:hypothetical protein
LKEGDMVRLVERFLVSILILIFVSFMGCSTDDDGEESEKPPELPPDSSMTMDFSAFGGGKAAPGLLLPGTHYINAATRVLLLDVAVIVALAPPAAVFKNARSATPVPQDDGSWLWSYTSIFLGIEYEANLTGWLAGNEVAWSMKITTDSPKTPLEDFKWYEGESALDNKSGAWRFFDAANSDESNQIGTIEWSVQDVDKAEIVFSNTNSKGPNFGDTLLYSIEGTTALISFYDASEDLTGEITWNIETIAGSIKVPYYNNGERAYWDEEKQNVNI